jgi:heat shock protein HslJ
MNLALTLRSLAICPLLLAAGCASRPAATQPTVAPRAEAKATLKTLAGTQWQVIEIYGETLPPRIEGWKPLTLEFASDGQAVNGYAGVNGFGGRCSLEGQKLSFGPLGMTRRAGPPALMREEFNFTQALGQVATWRQEGSTLVLLNGGGTAVIRLVPTVVQSD